MNEENKFKERIENIIEDIKEIRKKIEEDKALQINSQESNFTRIEVAEKDSKIKKAIEEVENIKTLVKQTINDI